MVENWDTYKLGDLIKLNYGKALTTKNRIKGAIPVYSSAGCTGSHNVPLIEEDGIIVGRKGTVGSVYKTDGPFYCIDTAYYILRNDTKYDFDYLYYLLQILGLNKLNYDSAVPGLNRDVAYDQEFNIPPLPEQKAIASILSAIDDKIELNLQMNKTLEEMAMTLYKHWFVDFGPFKDGKFVESELGMIPEGWEVDKIGELYKTTSGGTPSRKKPEYYMDGSIAWVKSKELYNNAIINTEEKITELGLNNSSAKLLSPKTVLLAMYGATVGECSLLSIEATCNQAICAIMQKDISYSYIFYFIKYYKKLILDRAVGSAQQNISQAVIKDLDIISPPKSLPVYKSLETILDKITHGLTENSKLEELRNTLLPKLISGQVRLKEFEQKISEAI